eukprot:TRINITY_DN15261_c0_g1_i1.p1 TRINITY_DN15261_c0_g1~~TRINITY_DN15261_c0_g1_i1.p1  ORF type:complete len:222 (-),score=23.57 TRINITY_DN15261_c0_g1_i1:177-842(-)
MTSSSCVPIGRIEAEFKRMQQDCLDSRGVSLFYLRYEDLSKLESLSELCLNYSHIPTLFCFNSGRDGKYSVDDIIQFVEICNSLAAKLRGHELEMQIRAYCTIQIWNVLHQADGHNRVVDWMLALITEGHQIRTFDTVSEPFVQVGAVAGLHSLLDVSGTRGMDLQTFQDLMQHVGEKMGLMQVHDKRFDDYVPQIVLRQFIESFVAGFDKLISELGLASD